MNTRKHPAPRPGETAKRFAEIGGPSSYNATDHSVNCILSAGSPVRRVYGVESLRISRDAINTERLGGGGIPLLDSHQQQGISNALGRVTEVWVKGNELWGKLTFNATQQGKLAEAMVARNELQGVSIGYSIEQWKVTDEDGREVDAAYASFDDNLNFEATRWTLLEASLVSVPADMAAGVRSLADTTKNVPQHIRDARARMLARQRMVDRTDRATVSAVKARMAARQRMIIP